MHWLFGLVYDHFGLTLEKCQNHFKEILQKGVDKIGQSELSLQCLLAPIPYMHRLDIFSGWGPASDELQGQRKFYHYITH